MQNVDGKETQGVSREEFQAFIKYFVIPMIRKDIQKRLEEANAMPNGIPPLSYSQKPLAEVVSEWQSMLHGASLAYDRGKWKSSYGNKAFKFAKDGVPFFLSLDRCPSYSFFIGKTRSKQIDCAEFGISMLQILRIPPHGHDLHQIVEHAIGVLKHAVHVYLDNYPGIVRSQVVFSDVVTQMEQAMPTYGATAWYKNMHRLKSCLLVVAAPREENVLVTKLRFDAARNSWATVPWKKVSGTAGNYCYMQLS